MKTLAPACADDKVQEVLARIEYRDQKMRNMGHRAFADCRAYLDGVKVWYQREYGMIPSRVARDPRKHLVTQWLLKSELCIEIWFTTFSVPMRELRELCKKHGATAQEHFYGPAGAGFPIFNDDEMAVRFILSDDYQRMKSEFYGE